MRQAIQAAIMAQTLHFTEQCGGWNPGGLIRRMSKRNGLQLTEKGIAVAKSLQN